ncbi:hypothetical protein BJ944DRAFT_273005 [Cunninghamella echinulata]|nr:hypothetical protein BJ944DRAFT_273005 [Cunninghamella echinulata]
MDAELMEEVIEQLNEEDSESDDNNSLIDSNSVNETEEEEDEEKENNVDNDSDKDSDDDNNSTTYVEQPIIKKDLSAKFRDYYMEKITVAFGSDLDQIRQDPALNTSRLNVLIDSLETGMGVFSDLEKDIMLTEAKK